MVTGALDRSSRADANPARPNSQPGKRTRHLPPESPCSRRTHFRPHEGVEDPARLPHPRRWCPLRHARHRPSVQPHAGWIGGAALATITPEATTGQPLATKAHPSRRNRRYLRRRQIKQTVPGRREQGANASATVARAVGILALTGQSTGAAMKSSRARGGRVCATGTVTPYICILHEKGLKNCRMPYMCHGDSP